MGGEYIVLERAAKYLDALGDRERAIVFAHAQRLSDGLYHTIRTKQLNKEVRELIVGPHRVTYCIHEDILYLMSAFRKKSRRTPRTEIEYAIHMHAHITQYEN